MSSALFLVPQCLSADLSSRVVTDLARLDAGWDAARHATALARAREHIIIGLDRLVVRPRALAAARPRSTPAARRTSVACPAPASSRLVFLCRPERLSRPASSQASSRAAEAAVGAADKASLALWLCQRTGR